MLKAADGDYGDLLNEEQHVWKTLLKSLKVTRYIAELYKKLKRVENTRYPGNYDASKFAKEMGRVKGMSHGVTYPLIDDTLTEQILQGLRGPMTQVRTVMNMIPNQSELANVLKIIENHCQIVLDSRRVNHF